MASYFLRQRLHKPLPRSPRLLLLLLSLASAASLLGPAAAARARLHARPRALTGASSFWAQFGLTPRHSGRMDVTAQDLSAILFSYKYDANVEQEIAGADGELLVHYMTPLTEGDAVYVMLKEGPYNDECKWRGEYEIHTGVDYKAPGSLIGKLWEPVFHGALANGFLYLPGAEGTVLKLDKGSGRVLQTMRPGGGVSGPGSYVSSPLSAAESGELYYTVVRVPVATTSNNTGFYANDIVGAWLVKVPPPPGDASTAIQAVCFSVLVPGAPTGNTCLPQFIEGVDDLPWPPNSTALPRPVKCGGVRAGLNAAPVISPVDGTVYVVARVHFESRYGWLAAVEPRELLPLWAVSLRERFEGGCGTPFFPPNGAPGGCRAGAKYGVDPATKLKGSGRVNDDSSTSPVVGPDGSIYYGSYNRYNYYQGQMMRFSAQGEFLGYFPLFGWDSTPAVYEHDGTFSIITKENHYNVSSYCDNETYCPSNRGNDTVYYVTQLSTDLATVEWRFQSTETDTCARNATTGQVSCTPNTNPYGFEWCVNAPAVDTRGVVYANSEDGWLYAINQGGGLAQRIFQLLTIGAAYTPASIGPSGLVYSQNSGYLIVVGSG